MLNTVEAKEASAQMLQQHSIPNIVSKDMMDLLPPEQQTSPVQPRHSQNGVTMEDGALVGDFPSNQGMV